MQIEQIEFLFERILGVIITLIWYYSKRRMVDIGDLLYIE